MPVTAKIEPFDEDIKIFISDMLSPAAQSEAFAEFAEKALEDAESENASILGYVPSHKTFVDGVETEQLDRVSPDGTIAFVFDLVDDLLGWIAAQLAQHAPFLKGRFRDSINLYADGTEVDPEADIPPASEYVFLSSVAYARKIEGSSGRKPESSQAPDGVFQVVATMASQRFNNQAKIRFQYRAPVEGDIVEWAKTPGAQALASRHHRRSHQTEWLTSVPAIVITVK